jgi:hypothetical protein
MIGNSIDLAGGIDEENTLRQNGKNPEYGWNID